MFTVSITGQIDQVKMLSENLYVKYQFVNGQDWTLLDGIEQGISQFTNSTLNVPLEIAYKSTSFYGWPMLLVTVYGLDFLGRDVVRGYSCTRLPCSAGTYTFLTKI
jgi:B9 domain-containing protein 1